MDTAPRIDEAAVKKSFFRNVTVMTLFETAWGLGMPFCMLRAVAPLYLLHLGTSKLLLQTVLVVVQLLTFTQLWSGRICAGPRRMFRNCLLYTLYAAAWAVYGGAALLFWDLLPKGLWIGLFIIAAVVSGLFVHLSAPVYGEVIIENVPKMRRGVVNTLRRLGLGSTMILGVLLTRKLMTTWPDPANFHLRYLIGGGLLMASCAIYLFMKDNAARARSAAADRVSALKSLRTLFGNFNFRVFLVFQMLAFAAVSLMPLILAYGSDRLGMKGAAYEFFIMAFSIGMIAVGLCVPVFADRFGFRTIAVVNTCLLATAFVIPVVLDQSRMAMYVAYGLGGGSISLYMMIMGNLGSELVPGVRPATIIAVGGSLAMPLSLALAPIGGWLVDTHGPAGYLCVFVVGATLSLCALIGFLLIVREPRSGQELYVRLRKF